MRHTASMVRVLGVIAAAVLLLAGCTTPAPEPTVTASPEAGPIPPPTEEDFTAVLAHTLSTPDPAPSTDGKVHLAYELVLNNVISQGATVESISVVGDGE